MRFLWTKQKLSNILEVDITETAGKSRYGQRQFYRRLGHGLTADCQIDLDSVFSGGDRDAQVRLLVEAMMQGGYFFGKKALKECAETGIYEVRDALACYPDHTVYLVSAVNIQETADDARLLGTCMGYARMLGDLPGNYLHTEEFASYAEEIARNTASGLQILGDAELKQMHCGGILGVNQASDREAKLIVLAHDKGQEESRTALVGKGILFDSGGYHLKSIDGMEGMKYDMCGAADALSLFEYLAAGGKELNVTAVIPIAENVLSPEGLKMGDVIETMSGKTVEVYNTDAEGRLLLCDALTFACTCTGADTVLDLATLTYSCRNALGDGTVGLFSNHDALCRRLAAAAELSGEKLWRLPLDEIYHEQLKWSKTADLANYVPKKGGGASIAACFLEEFITCGMAWAHFDLAGPAVLTKDTEESQAGATGTIISTAAAYLRSEAEKQRNESEKRV